MDALGGFKVGRAGLRWTVETDAVAIPFPVDATTPADDLAASIVACMPDDGKEHLVAVCLNVRGVPLAWQIVASGTVDACPLYPRDILTFALAVPGTRFVGVAHNHPSGAVDPSGPDVSGTAAVHAAGRIVGFDLVWSLVVTHRGPQWSAIPLPAGKVPTGGEDEPIERPPVPPPPPGEDETTPPEPEPEPEPGEDETTAGTAPPPPAGASSDDLAAAIEKLIGSLKR